MVYDFFQFGWSDEAIIQVPWNGVYMNCIAHAFLPNMKVYAREQLEEGYI